ncbi:MAG: Rrf2 family transcriptional regulator [Candidatus Omnitrophica bacterium]|nr:Rrf2 family transcriptional regulator [Candidatus Omnitrophota bacterium]
MKLISRNTDYAVRAVCYIARQDKKIVSVVELVKALGIPGPFLRKILQVLNKKRILISNKGSGGGFKLARKEDKIFLSELMEAFQGPFRLNECTFKKELCPNKKFCWLKNKIDIIEDMVLSQLSTVTIDSILKGK